MGMTISEKIIAAHAGRDAVRPDELVMAEVDICLGNDITAPIAIKEMEAHGFTEVHDPDRICLIPDHFTPNKDIQSAEQALMLREFARRHKLKHYYEIGRMGIEHALLPEQGIVGPGDLIIGADSHTCTYGALGAFSTGVGSTDLAAAMISGKVWLRVPPTTKFVYTGTPDPWFGGKDLILETIGRISVSGATYEAMEFAGPYVRALEMDGRLTVCNMAIEAGAKAGLIAPDDVTRAYCEGRCEREPTYYASDPDADYLGVVEVNLDGLGPVVALPHLPENTKPVEECGDVTIDQVVIGSCTNGRISDLRVAAHVLKGRKAAPNVRLIIIPATQAIYAQAMKEGLFEIFLEAEAVVSTPTCGPCLGGHMGVLAAGERALATTNRNFVGRMGHPKSEVCLCGPAVAAASAVTGVITHPRDVAGEPPKA